MSTIAQGQWPSIVQKDLSLIFLNQHRTKTSMGPLLYRNKKAEQGTEYDLETGDIGTVPAFGGEITYDSVAEGYKKSVSETEYALGLKVTRRLLRNDLYGVIQDRTALLGSAFHQLRENRFAFPFVNAFNTSFTVGDGLAMCSASHTSAVGGSTQSNTDSNAFSAANVEAARIKMSKYKTNRDNPMDNIMDTLLVPVDLAEKAYEIIKSAGKVDTSVNNRNFHEGKYKLIVWPNYLTSTTNWFGLNSEILKQMLVFREWEPTQFFRSGEFDTLVSKFAGYASFEVSMVGWRGVYGSSN